jgi:SAM-dependent methyltransferase
MSYGKVNKTAWENEAQAGELAFHSKLCRLNPDYPLDKLSGDAWAWTGLNQLSLKDCRVMDLGCGPIVKGLWFIGAEVIAVDPLADDYIKNVSWQRISQADLFFSVGAESFIPELADTVDAVVSRNALDHGYDFELATVNISRYLKKGGKAYLEFDIHTETDKLHQMQMTPRYCEDCFHACGLEIVNHSVEPEKRNLGDAHFYELRKK